MLQPATTNSCVCMWVRGCGSEEKPCLRRLPGFDPHTPIPTHSHTGVRVGAFNLRVKSPFAEAWTTIGTKTAHVTRATCATASRRWWRSALPTWRNLTRQASGPPDGSGRCATARSPSPENRRDRQDGRLVQPVGHEGVDVGIAHHVPLVGPSRIQLTTLSRIYTPHYT